MRGDFAVVPPTSACRRRVQTIGRPPRDTASLCAGHLVLLVSTGLNSGPFVSLDDHQPSAGFADSAVRRSCAPNTAAARLLRREGDGDDAKLTVSFPGYGLKKLVEEYAGIKEE